MKRSESQPLSPAAQLMAIEIISELLVSTSPHKLGEVLTEHLRELSGARTAMVLVHRCEPETDELLNVSPLRRRTLFTPAELNNFCHEKSPALLPFHPEELPVNHPLQAPLLRAGIRSMLRYPLRVVGELVGLLLLFDLPEIKRSAEIDRIINLLTPPIALALKNALAFRQIEQQALELEKRVAERTAELQEKNTELERFTYTASHDLKSPLVTIQTFAGMIRHDLEAGNHDRPLRDLRRIEDAAGKMNDLLNDLLELSLIGKQMNSASRIDMNRLVKETLMQLAGIVTQGRIEVVVQPDIPPVMGDRKRIAELLQNLIENAVKYRGDQPASRIEIGVRQEGKECVFFVSDNGKGIDPRHHEKIFGLFNQLDADSEGTGVGLALVKRIIEAHGGRVWVESEGEGKGSRFCFTIKKEALQ